MSYPNAEYWHEVRQLDIRLYRSKGGERKGGALAQPVEHIWNDSEGREIGWKGWRGRRLIGGLILKCSWLVVGEKPPLDIDSPIESEASCYIYLAETRLQPGTSALKKFTGMLCVSDQNDPIEVAYVKQMLLEAGSKEDALGLLTPETQDYEDLLHHLRSAANGEYEARKLH